MLRRGINIILFLFILSYSGKGQALSLGTLLEHPSLKPSPFFSTDYLNQNVRQVKTPAIRNILRQTAFKAEQLPIFCKIEHQLAKKSKVNFKFRLGSIDYVDRLEGK